MSELVPFPWYGSKRRQAADIWDRLGDPTVYVEPFAGSLACLLSRPGGAGHREIVCDLDGGICNWWRAVTAEPEAVAEWADYPTIHQDLTARHRWLYRWFEEHRDRLTEDPLFYDAQAAGWWVWGISIWIGGRWCQPAAADEKTIPFPGGGGVSAQRKTFPPERRPHCSGGQGVSAQSRPPERRPEVPGTGGGRGVAAQRRTFPEERMPQVSQGGGRGVSAQRVTFPEDKRPYVADRDGGQGVSAQRGTFPVPDKRPHVDARIGGRGVAAQRHALMPDRRDLLVAWFRRLQERLARVVVLNRSWESALTPSLLMRTATSRNPPVGVLLDPPYRLDTGRDSNIYISDADGTSNDAATASWEWALEHGDDIRICYCCHAGDFEIPDGWTSYTAPFKGIRDPERRATVEDMLIFSPACEPQATQATLFGVG